MLQLGFEHTTPVFKREKKAHGLDRAAIVVGGYQDYIVNVRLCIVSESIDK
jgi:hypothetical protein